MAEDLLEARMREIEHTVTRLEGTIGSGDQLAQTEIKLLKAELELLKTEVSSLDEGKVDVTRYIVVERIVFGLVTLVLSSVVVALIALVVSSSSGRVPVP